MVIEFTENLPWLFKSVIPGNIWKFCGIEVADCDTREFTDQKREEMLVSDFIARCLLQEEASPVQCNNETCAINGASVSVPYLKDWHFVKVYLLAFIYFSID